MYCPNCDWEIIEPDDCETDYICDFCRERDEDARFVFYGFDYELGVEADDGNDAREI